MRESMPRATSELLQTSPVGLHDTVRRLKQLSKVFKHRKATDIVEDRSPGQAEQLRLDIRDASLVFSQQAAPPRQLSTGTEHSTKVESSPSYSEPAKTRGKASKESPNSLALYAAGRCHDTLGKHGGKASRLSNDTEGNVKASKNQGKTASDKSEVVSKGPEAAPRTDHLDSRPSEQGIAAQQEEDTRGRAALANTSHHEDGLPSPAFVDNPCTARSIDMLDQGHQPQGQAHPVMDKEHPLVKAVPKSMKPCQDRQGQ